MSHIYHFVSLPELFFHPGYIVKDRAIRMTNGSHHKQMIT